MLQFQDSVSQQPKPLTAYWPLAGGQIQLTGKKSSPNCSWASFNWSRPHGGWCRCMLIYALTGQVWTIQLIRAVPTILFCKTEPTKDSGLGKRHNTGQNQTTQNKTDNTEQQKSRCEKKNTQTGIKKRRRATNMHRKWEEESDGRGETCTMINNRERVGGHSRHEPLSQRQLTLMQRPLLQVNWVRGKHVG